MNSEPSGESSPRQAHRADVLLYVEQEGPSKFRIGSNQLEQIGTKLRGRPQFSVFNSLVLPALVTVATTILTGAFQYVSWLNTVRQQAASAIADRAIGTFDQAST